MAPWLPQDVDRQCRCNDGPLARHLQAGHVPQSQAATGSDLMPVARKEHPDPAIAIARVLPREGARRLRHRGILGRQFRDVAQRRGGHPQQSTRPRA